MEHYVWFEPVVWSCWCSCQVKNLEQTDCSCHPAHHCDLEVYEMIPSGLLSLEVIINITLHFQHNVFIYFFGATFLPYWYHPSFLAARQVVWSDTWRKNRTVHLGLNAEWGSVWKSLLEPYINLELQTRPYCISTAGDWSGEAAPVPVQYYWLFHVLYYTFSPLASPTVNQ